MSSQNSKLKRPKLITTPGEPFEKDDDIIGEVNDIVETIMTSGNCVTTPENYADEVAAWWGEVDSHDNYFSGSDEDV